MLGAKNGSVGGVSSGAQGESAHTAVVLSDVINWGIGVLSLIVAVAALLASRKPRRLRSKVVVSKPLMQRHRLIPDGSEATHPRVMIVEIKNSGKSHFQRSDFIDPISVTVHRASKILGADIFVWNGFSTDRVEYAGEYVDARTLRMTPDLLNRGDRLVFKMVVDTRSKYVAVWSRVADARLTHHNPVTAPPWVWKLFLVFCLMTGPIAAWGALQL